MDTQAHQQPAASGVFCLADSNAVDQQYYRVRVNTLSFPKSGFVNGHFNINPNNLVPERFEMTTTNGTTITWANLTNNFTFAGKAVHITLAPGGSGAQTTLPVDFAPYPMANALQWDLSASSMNVTIRQTTGNSGRYQIRTFGEDVLITGH